MDSGFVVPARKKQADIRRNPAKQEPPTQPQESAARFGLRQTRKRLHCGLRGRSGNSIVYKTGQVLRMDSGFVVPARKKQADIRAAPNPHLFR